MKSRTLMLNVLAAVVSMVALVGSAAADLNLVRGEDFIETPAIGEGLCVHNLFQSNMVLQRDKTISIRGWAEPGEVVTVGFAGGEQSATAAKDRSWAVELPAMPANAKPQTMTIKGKDKTITLANILIGDVWVLGGQSNMEFPISRVENGLQEIVSANFPEIRILTVPQLAGPNEKNAFPQMYLWSGWFGRHYAQGYWEVCTPRTVRELSAIGYVFARRIHMATAVPIGVIDASIGGTTVETWTPRAALESIDSEPVKSLLADWNAKVEKFDPQKDLEDRIANYNARTERLKNDGKDVSGRTPPTDLRRGPAFDKNRPGNCYAGVLAPLKGLAVKGAIWHQGYNNCFNGTAGAMMYADAFPVMIESWRKVFGDPDMAFGILTLCTQGNMQTREDYTESMIDTGPYIREAQYKAFRKFLDAGDKNVGLVSTYDLRRRWYHPQLKIPAGERIARWALATQYGDVGKGLAWEQALLQDVSVDGASLVLKFDRTIAAEDNGLPMEGFAIAGADRKFHPADATHLVTGKDGRGRDQYDRKTVVLSSLMVPNPVAFRYAWARSPMGNVRVGGGTTDVPLATLRSDDWPLEQIPLGLFGEEQPTKLDRAQRGQIRQALRQIDLDRRLAEAKALIEEHESKD